LSTQLNIRPECPEDIFRVYSLNTSAFETYAEARLVDRLREEADPIISLVADLEGEIAGQILFSPVTIDDHPDLLLMGLAPMAVRPEHQRQGIGTALVHAGLEACRDMGVVGAVVLGHPEFYPRFDFVPASQFDIGCEYDVPDEVFMALELKSGVFSRISGVARYHSAFADL